MSVDECWWGIIEFQRIITRDSQFIIQSRGDKTQSQYCRQIPTQALHTGHTGLFMCQFNYNTLPLCYFKSQFIIIRLPKQRTMNILRKYFSFSQIDRFLFQNQLFNPKTRPDALMLELQSERGNYQLQTYLCSALSAQQQVKLVGLLTTLVLYSSDFYELVQNCLQDGQESSDWLISKIVMPLKRVLIKCSSTAQCFQSTKNRQFKKQLMVQNLSYPIKLIEQVILIGKQLPKLGRYYNNSANSQIYQFLGETYMLLLDHLYTSFRYTLEIYLWNASKQLDFTDFPQIQQMLQWVMLEVVPPVNQAILQINTIKYFRFVEKGYTVKLFAIQQQSQAVQLFYRRHILQQKRSQSKQQQGQEGCQISMLQQAVSLLQQVLVKNESHFSTDGSNQSSMTDRQGRLQCSAGMI